MSVWRFAAWCLLPLLIFTVAFLVLPLAQLFHVSVSSDSGYHLYTEILQKPRYLTSLWYTFLVSSIVAAAALAVGTASAVFLARNHFPGRHLLISAMTLPLAFPGVVVGFLIILLAGRQGLLNDLLPGRVVLAYSLWGLFLGYLYFSIPRVLLTVMAAVEKLDPDLEAAARTLGAPQHRVLTDIILPGLAPALVASAAIAFATAMGAFGTAFTLATNIDVLPMVIYTEFTLSANIATAAALSFLLGLVTWVILVVARSFAGATVAAGG